METWVAVSIVAWLAAGIIAWYAEILRNGLEDKFDMWMIVPCALIGPLTWIIFFLPQ